MRWGNGICLRHENREREREREVTHRMKEKKKKVLFLSAISLSLLVYFFFADAMTAVHGDQKDDGWTMFEAWFSSIQPTGGPDHTNDTGTLP